MSKGVFFLALLPFARGQSYNYDKSTSYVSARDVDLSFLLLCGALVFSMQCGFTLLEVGMVRSKNAKSILIKNMLDALISALAWFLLGYPLAFGQSVDLDAELNHLIGWGQFLLLGSLEQLQQSVGMWFFHWTFASTASTIVSGALAERTQPDAYVVFTFFNVAIFYPLVVHWAWGGSGWLKEFHIFGEQVSFVDFAGSVVVHASGGFSALVGAYLVGPRRGRFSASGEVFPLPPHNLVLTGIGTYFLWFGWYGFNVASTDGLTSMATPSGLGVSGATTAAFVMVNVTLSATFGGLVSYGISSWGGSSEVVPLHNGILSGLTAVNAACHILEPWCAAVVGIVAGANYILWNKLMLRWRIDDPLDAFAVHGANGVWGGLAAGLLGSNRSGSPGLFFGYWRQIVVQVIGCLAICSWAMLTAYVTFKMVQKFMRGGLRVSPMCEVAGLDVTFYGGSAYPDFEAKTGPPLDGEVCLVMTDIEGSTKLWEDLPAHVMYHTQSLHDSIMRKAIVDFHGYEVSTEGDAFCVSFHSVLDAVKWCCAVQVRLLDSQWPSELLAHHCSSRVPVAEVEDLWEEGRRRSSVMEKGDSSADGDTPHSRKLNLFQRFWRRKSSAMSCARESGMEKRRRIFEKRHMAARKFGETFEEGEEERTGNERGGRQDLFRGVRVRMAVDYGHAEHRIDEVTQRVRYFGPVALRCKALVDSIPSGGQIVMTERAHSQLGTSGMAGGWHLLHLGRFQFPRASPLGLNRGILTGALSSGRLGSPPLTGPPAEAPINLVQVSPLFLALRSHFFEDLGGGHEGLLRVFRRASDREVRCVRAVQGGAERPLLLG